MFCTYCGAQLRDTARYCNRCGKPTRQWERQQQLLDEWLASIPKIKPALSGEADAASLPDGFDPQQVIVTTYSLFQIERVRYPPRFFDYSQGQQREMRPSRSRVLLQIDLKFWNGRARPFALTDRMCQVQDSNGQRYAAIGQKGPMERFFDIKVPPRRVLEGKIVYEVPSNVLGFQFYVTDDEINWYVLNL